MSGKEYDLPSQPCGAQGDPARAAGEALPSASFTPGPWRLEEGTALVWGHCIEEDETSFGLGYPVAEARVRLGRGTYRFDHEVAHANAVLIAAAPEMYEALKAHYEQAIPFAERQALARAAIAKAEGK